MGRARNAVILLGALAMAGPVDASLSKSEKKQAEKMIEGTLYLRVDVPCRYSRGHFGMGVQPVLEVSPDGFDREKLLADTGEDENVGYGFDPNDPVRYGSLEFSGNRVRVWLEGAVKPKNDEIMLEFAQIETFDDFKRAFDRTFSTVPLQDEYPDWPAEVRKAIAERRVIQGMTKKQAFCVVGTPVSLSKVERDGHEVESWFPRQDNGVILSLRKAKTTRTGFPAALEFVDGVLEKIEEAPRTLDLGLDK